MSSFSATVPEVFTAREIAAAADVPPADVRALIANGSVGTMAGRFVTATDAVRIVRKLRGLAVPATERPLFDARPVTKRSPGALVASGTLHGAALILFVL